MKKARESTFISTLVLSASLMTLSSAPFAAENLTSTTPTERHSLHLDDDAWINDIGTLLYADLDGDGYFSGLSLSIDVDSRYSQHEVYVIVDIVDETSVSERLHTTRSFHVYGRSLSDEYRIDIDLVQNYYPGIYDLQISLVDERDNRLLDQVNASDFRNLSALPLESEDNQTVSNPVSERPVDAPNDDVRVVEYAGSTGFGFFLVLLASVLFRNRRV